MGFKKYLGAFAGLLLVVSSSYAQDLAEAAKKEQARREQYKNKKVVVITNSSLGSLKKRAALGKEETTAPPSQEEEVSSFELLPSEEEEAPEEASSQKRIIPQVTVAKTPVVSSSGLQDRESGSVSTNGAQARWQKAKEYADLLETRMNALWQEFYSLDDMTSRDSIQKEIAETYDKYLRAREEEARAKEVLDKSPEAVKKD